MDQHLDLFLNYLLVEKGLSANTLEAYGRDTARYLDSLAKSGITSITEVRAIDVATFIGSLQAKGVGARSRARALSAVKMFHRFLMIENYCSTDPT